MGLAFLDARPRREERRLAKKFPEYADCQQRVRELVPFLYTSRRRTYRRRS